MMNNLKRGLKEGRSVKYPGGGTYDGEFKEIINLANIIMMSNLSPAY